MRGWTKRRFVKATATVAGGVVIGGCLGGGNEEELKEGARQVEDEVRSSVTVDITVEVNGGWCQITYISGALSTDESAEEIRTIVEAYVGAVEDGYSLGRAAVDVYNADGVEIGEWRIEEKWIDRYQDGTLTMDGVFQKAAGTIST